MNKEDIIRQGLEQATGKWKDHFTFAIEESPPSSYEVTIRHRYFSFETFIFCEFRGGPEISGDGEDWEPLSRGALFAEMWIQTAAELDHLENLS